MAPRATHLPLPPQRTSSSTHMAAPKCPSLCPLPCPVHLPKVITVLIYFHHSLNSYLLPSDPPPGKAPGSAGKASARAESGHTRAGCLPGECPGVPTHCCSRHQPLQTTGWPAPPGLLPAASNSQCLWELSKCPIRVTIPPRASLCLPVSQFPSLCVPQTPAHQLHQQLPVPRQQCPLDLFLVQGRQGPKSSRQEEAEGETQETWEAQNPGGYSWIPGGSQGDTSPALGRD